ncbi:MAG: AAA family ATPase [bacterium]
MAKIISVVNQKGGVGKTTTAVNLGAYLAQHGKFVLLVDIDSQANATSGLGIDPQTIRRGLYHVLMGEHDIHDVVVPTKIEGYHLAPSSVDLAGATIDLVPMERREYRLYDSLLGVKNDYDYILIDCPPSLGLLTVNGLVAGDEALIPVQCEYYALEGLGQLLKTINLVRENLKPELTVRGAVMTMYDDRNKLSEAIMHQLYQYFPGHIYRTVIPRNIRLAEAPSHGSTIFEYDPKSRGGRAYERFAREFLEHDLHALSFASTA